MKGKERNRYFEALRGIAIIMVVAIHTYNKDSTSSFELLARQVCNCAVPLFFAMSGYFLYNKSLADKEKLMSFWKHQIPKVYIPVLVWSFPWFLIGILHGNIVKPSLILLSCGYKVYYFVAVIIQFYLLLPLLQRYKTGSFVGGVFLTASASSQSFL